MSLGEGIFFIILALIIGLVVGFFLSRKYMMKYFEKNPPITEDVVRTMMAQMGRTPSQKQVNQVMRSINPAGSKPKKKDKK